MVIYVSVQEIKHDTNKTRDNSTDTFKSNGIVVVRLMGIGFTGRRGSQTVSMYIVKEKGGVENSGPEHSDLKPLCAVFLTWHLTNRSH